MDGLWHCSNHINRSSIHLPTFFWSCEPPDGSSLWRRRARCYPEKRGWCPSMAWGDPQTMAFPWKIWPITVYDHSIYICKKPIANHSNIWRRTLIVGSPEEHVAQELMLQNDQYNPWKSTQTAVTITTWLWVPRTLGCSSTRVVWAPYPNLWRLESHSYIIL